MNLVEKLPIGLGLACVLMMSSCSKDDVLTPEPQNEIVNYHSSLKEAPSPGPLTIKIPYLASTYGLPGFNIYPTDWERGLVTSNKILGLPSGTSNTTHLFGNASYPWRKALPQIPALGFANSFLTVTSRVKFYDPSGDTDGRSSVTSKITNLVPGKVYRVNFYVASTVPAVAQNGYGQECAGFVIAKLKDSNVTHAINVGVEAVWLPEYLTFTATSSETTITFSAYTQSENKFSYAHIFLDKNSIKQIDY